LLSAERVRHELDLALEEDNSMAVLQHMADLGILATVHPALEWNESVRDRFLTANLDDRGPDRLLSRRLLGWSLSINDYTLKPTPAKCYWLPPRCGLT
jgi:tRNA nucleotidyltransferase/poly(A) polymerase